MIDKELIAISIFPLMILGYILFIGFCILVFGGKKK